MGIVDKLREIAANKLVLANQEHAECDRLAEGLMTNNLQATEMYVEHYRKAVEYSEEYMTIMVDALQLELESEMLTDLN
jgi:hypothetical protein